ncbi:MAG: aminotransferase class V-fold PLP-dependent enzyme [Treponema sp.]|jgi:cysteine desulfurase|nr:aminotransferase class V-fold PLP-dependent enzyme [Treponema sp.]
MTAALPPRRYFDWAATAPPEAGAAAAPFGNPSSLHAEGRAARESLEAARSRCAAALGLKPETVYFSSGGTESNAMPILSFLLRPGAGACLYSATEHPSVRENCRILEKMGKTVGVIPVEADGRVSAAGLGRALEKNPESRFAAIMAVNNETGALNDLGALREGLRGKDGPPLHVHCDMVQAAGKVPADISLWDLDSASLSAHKLGGPRGVGLLYLRKPLETLYRGGGQEGGIRAGTENVAGALALAACLETHAERLETSLRAARERLDQLMRGLEATGRYSPIPACRTSAEDGRFSPYILQAAFDGVPGEVMARALDQAGFAVSTGSACASGKAGRPVLEAMGLGPKQRLEGIRISQGWSTTPDDIEALVRAAAEALAYL